MNRKKMFRFNSPNITEITSYSRDINSGAWLPFAAMFDYDATETYTTRILTSGPESIRGTVLQNMELSLFLIGIGASLVREPIRSMTGVYAVSLNGRPLLRMKPESRLELLWVYGTDIQKFNIINAFRAFGVILLEEAERLYPEGRASPIVAIQGAAVIPSTTSQPNTIDSSGFPNFTAVHIRPNKVLALIRICSKLGIGPQSDPQLQSNSAGFVHLRYRQAFVESFLDSPEQIIVYKITLYDSICLLLDGKITDILPTTRQFAVDGCIVYNSILFAIIFFGSGNHALYGLINKAFNEEGSNSASLAQIDRFWMKINPMLSLSQFVLQLTDPLPADIALSKTHLRAIISKTEEHLPFGDVEGFDTPFIITTPDNQEASLSPVLAICKSYWDVIDLRVDGPDEIERALRVLKIFLTEAMGGPRVTRFEDLGKTTNQLPNEALTSFVELTVS
jgi:hypothetical protein